MVGVGLISAVPLRNGQVPRYTYCALGTYLAVYTGSIVQTRNDFDRHEGKCYYLHT